MQLPFFYHPADIDNNHMVLDEVSSRHIVQVLRMRKDEGILITDGRGHRMNAVIEDPDKKKCRVLITATTEVPKPGRHITIAISLLKNAARFEWFLEKSTELGVSNIVPLICARTERQKFRFERMQAICVSAMLQSQQCWLPVLFEPMPLDQYLEATTTGELSFIAHCANQEKTTINSQMNAAVSSCRIAIGPEGDFTETEINLALKQHFIPVTLGDTRLRTETAGIAAVVLLMHA
jgi:16S rRNA (uracil1498-N3)-methyltransferase